MWPGIMNEADPYVDVNYKGNAGCLQDCKWCEDLLGQEPVQDNAGAVIEETKPSGNRMILRFGECCVKAFQALFSMTM